MTVVVENESGQEFDFPYVQLAEDVVNAAMDAEDFPYEAEVNVLLVTREEIHRINMEQRQIDAPTDVLSFPLIAYPAAGDFSKVEEDSDNFNPDTGEALLGDIILCVDKIKEQAAEYGHSERREYAFLILHSMLHLFGYDHMTEQEAAIMEQKQRNILEDMQVFR
jgi:probable rRNA maturation factor